MAYGHDKLQRKEASGSGGYREVGGTGKVRTQAADVRLGTAREQKGRRTNEDARRGGPVGQALR
jgi:hypothetical protein